MNNRTAQKLGQRPTPKSTGHFIQTILWEAALTGGTTTRGLVCCILFPSKLESNAMDFVTYMNQIDRCSYFNRNSEGSPECLLVLSVTLITSRVGTWTQEVIYPRRRKRLLAWQLRLAYELSQYRILLYGPNKCIIHPKIWDQRSRLSKWQSTFC